MNGDSEDRDCKAMFIDVYSTTLILLINCNSLGSAYQSNKTRHDVQLNDV